MRKLFCLLLLATFLSGCLRTPSQAAPFRPFEVAPSGSGQVLYVAPDGNDEDNGSEQKPLATIQAAVQRATSGSVIRLLPGVWHTAFVIDYKGSAEKPLTIEGARDSAGRWLSVVDGSRPIDPDQWTARPDLGPNVYSLPVKDVGSMLVDGKLIKSLYKEAAHERGGKRLFTAAEIMKWPNGQTFKYRDYDVPVWETIGGAYSEWVIPEQTVLRFADGSDPSTRKMSLSSNGAVIKMDGSSHVTLRGVQVQGGEFGVEISGKGATDNSVQECFIQTGRRRILLGDGAENTRVIGNRIEFGFIGYTTGAWGESNFSEGHRLSEEEKAVVAKKAFVYTYFKYWATRASTSDDASIDMQRGSSNTLVQGNSLEGGLIGIRASSGSKNATVIGNEVRHFSSVGTVVTAGVDAVTYDGNFFYDCNINVRLHEMNADEPPRQIRILRNISMQPKGVGTHIFHHFLPVNHSLYTEDYPEHRVTFAHNTFLGGARGMTVPAAVSEGKGFPQYVFVNNRFVGCEAVTWATKKFIDDPAKIGAFDYNQIIGGVVNRHGTPSWQGKHCIVSEEVGDWRWSGGRIVPPAPENDPGRGAGVDVSRPYIVDKNGPITLPAIPGFEQKYFGGENPDLGAPLRQPKQQ